MLVLDEICEIMHCNADNYVCLTRVTTDLAVF